MINKVSLLNQVFTLENNSLLTEDSFNVYELGYFDHICKLTLSKLISYVIKCILDTKNICCICITSKENGTYLAKDLKNMKIKPVIVNLKKSINNADLVSLVTLLGDDNALELYLEVIWDLSKNHDALYFINSNNSMGVVDLLVNNYRLETFSDPFLKLLVQKYLSVLSMGHDGLSINISSLAIEESQIINKLNNI